jgi:hypothetical protein
MPAITLESIQTKQTELAALIQQLLQTAQVTQIEIDGCTIELQPGERYSGAVLDEFGQHMHHLVLMAQRPKIKLTWQPAMDWAEEVGGTLPTRQEQALLYANCKPHIKPEWHWSCETHKDDASYAWGCHFDVGHQDYYLKSSEGSAVAVRRV